MPISQENPFADLVPQQQQEAQQPPTSNMSEGNPFADLTSPQGGQQGQDKYAQDKWGTPKPGSIADVLKNNPKAPTQESSGNAFLDGVEAFNRTFGRKAEGAMQIVAKMFNMPELEQKIKQENAAKESSLVNAQARSPTATMVGGITGELGSAVAYGGGGVGLAKTGAAKVGAAIVGGAAMSAVEHAPTEQDRLERAGMGGAIGGIVGGVLNIPFKAIKNRVQGALTSNEGVSSFKDKVFDPKKAAAEDLAYNVESTVGKNLDEVKKIAKNNTELGANASPGETIGGNILRTAEGKNLPTTPQTRKVQKFLDKHDGAALKGLQKTVDDMTPQGYTAAKTQAKELYGEVRKIEVDPLTTGEILQNDVIRKTLLKIDKGDISDLQGLKNSNLHRLDGVKRRLDQDIYDAKASVKPEYGDVLGPKKEARKLLMEKLAPYQEYTDARNVAQRVIVRADYIKALGKKQAASGQRGIHSVNEVFDALFSGDKKAKFLNDVDKTGGDVAHTKKVIDLFDQLRSSPIKSLLKKPETAGVEVAARGRVVAMIQDAVNKFATKEYHNAVLELNLSGQKKWIKAIEAVYNTPDKSSRLQGFLKIIKGIVGKASKTELGKQVGDSVSTATATSQTGYLQ